MLLARRFGAAIVSVDSAQVYRGMDIGTAKPSATERGEVAHHLIDQVDEVVAFSVALWPSTFERPTTVPPHPPTIQVQCALPTGNVRPQKKSLPAVRRASNETS